MDTVYNRITVTFRHIPRITGPEILYQEDVTQILVIQGLDLPEYFVVDFCNEGDTTVVPITGTAEGVEIPDALLATGKTVKAYIVVSAGEGDVETRYMVKLPVQRRPSRSDIEPTDPQQQQIDALVANLNDGVSRAESAADTATQAAQLLQNPSAEATTLEAGSEATASYEDGTFFFGIPKGPKGDPMTYEDMTEEQKAELVQGPILEAQTAGVRAVNAAGTAKVSQINQAGTTNVNAVNQEGETQVGNVNQAGTTQVGNVNAAGDEQVQAVIDKGAEVRDSIPQDYTDLTENVTRLNQAINLLDDQVNDSTTGLDTKAPAIVNTASGAIASFSDGANGMPVKKLVVNIEPKQAGTGDPSPDNIRPISGWTGAEIEQSGKNLLDVANATHNAYNIGSIHNMLKSGATYTFSINGITNNRYRLYLAKSNAPLTALVALISAYIPAGVSQTFTAPIMDGYDSLCIAGAPNGAGNEPLDNILPQIELGSTATSYEPYTGNQISVTFPSAAGTVYGGTDEVVSGNLKSTMTLTPQFRWIRGNVNDAGDGRLFYAYFTDSGTNVLNVKAYNGAIKKADRPSRWEAQEVNSFSMSSNTENPSNILVVSNDPDMTLDQFTAWLDAIGNQFLCTLKTPQEYTHEGHSMTTIYGTNNIWADCGDTSVTYAADTKLYIEHLTQPTEDDMTADHAISSGTFFMLGNTLYLATSQIAAGATITPGTNATQLSLADALNQLNA